VYVATCKVGEMRVVVFRLEVLSLHYKHVPTGRIALA
jgi:hypothetical protein